MEFKIDMEHPGLIEAVDDLKKILSGGALMPLGLLLDDSELPWPEIAIPELSVGQFGEWTVELAENPPLVIRGYFRALRRPPDPYYILKRGREVWMSITPRELEALMPHVANAEGHTVIAGLGLGIALYNVLSKPEVNRVSLLENDDSVIDWFEGQDTADWKGIEKLEIVRGDARETKILSPVDFLYVDIWNVLGAEEALEDTIAIQKNIKAGKVGYWGQEMTFIYWLAERGSKPPPTEQQYDAWVKSTGMPLLKEEYHWLRALEAAQNVFIEECT